jgi:hypothetical protein
MSVYLVLLRNRSQARKSRRWVEISGGFYLRQ